MEHGTRQLLNQCPVIPLKDLLGLLKWQTLDVARINHFLDTTYMSDEKKRGHPSTAERRQNKRDNVYNYPPTEKKKREKKPADGALVRFPKIVLRN